MKPLPLVLLLGICLALSSHSGASGTVTTVQTQRGFASAYGPEWNQTNDLLKQLVDRATIMDGRLERIEAKIAGAPEGSSNNALTIIAKNCLECHKDPANKGDNFIIVRADGTLDDLTPGGCESIVRKVTKGEMPPKGALNPEETKAIELYFSELAKQKRKGKSR